MYLYFEDQSRYLFILDQKHIPHGDRIIKTYASETDPRIKLNNPNLAVFEISDSPFSNEIFTYTGRETYSGIQIEEIIKNLRINDLGKRITRALFRFSNRPDLEFCQTAMSIIKDGNWLIDHPLGDIDGLNLAANIPESRTRAIHLDIFMPRSLERLDNLIHFSDPEHLVSMREGLRLKGFELSLRNRRESE